jgi:hypothetical protein
LEHSELRRLVGLLQPVEKPESAFADVRHSRASANQAANTKGIIWKTGDAE